MEPLIKIEHVRKVYRMGDEKVLALDDVSLDIYKGEIVCFLGTSGSGKSTFLNMVAGLEKPTRGHIFIGGIPIHKLNEAQVTLFRQKNIGFIFQAYHLMPMLTALENVSLPLAFRGVPKRKRNALAKQALKAVGLVGYDNRKPSQMSGGQQQRVGIARALAGVPKIIFADEPTGNLDTNTTKEVMNLIVGQVRKHNQTLILVTHDRSIADYADKVVTIQDGNIIGVENRQGLSIAEAEKIAEAATSEIHRAKKAAGTHGNEPAEDKGKDKECPEENQNKPEDKKEEVEGKVEDD